MSAEENRRIAKKRKEEISYSRTRIERKIKDMPKDARVSAWEKRLSEYDQSMELIEFTIKTGKAVKLKGEESENGVVIAPPVGKLKMESN